MYMRERFHAELAPMPNTISMDVTEGAQWFLRDDERTTFYSWNEFPCLLPPAEDLWLEFLFPRQLHTDAGLVDKNKGVNSKDPSLCFTCAYNLCIPDYGRI